MATLEYVVRATDASSAVFQKIGLSADRLDRQLGDLSKRIATPEVDLKDAKFTLGMINAAKRLDKLSAMVADPEVDVDTAKAQTEILRITAMLDRLDAKRVNVTVGVNTRQGIFSHLGGLLGGAGAGAGAAGAAGPFGIGALIAAALALAPAAIPLGLGGLIGGGGALAGLKIGSTAHQKLLQMQQSLHNITGTTPSSAAARTRLQAQIALFQKTNADQLQLGAAGAGFQHSLTGTFLDALTSRGPGFSAGPRGQPGGSFLTGLTGILKQLAGFIKSIGPGLGDLFRASLPFVSAFVKVMERFARIILPVATQMLKQFTPYLPMMTKGFVYLAQGLAGFLKGLGPGMKDSAIIFVAAAKVTMGLMQLLGVTVSGFAIAIVKTAEGIRWFARQVPRWFDDVRHALASFGHFWAAQWDGARHTVATFGHNLAASFDAWRHLFATFGHDAMAIWNALWNGGRGLVALARSGIGAIVGWFRKLPGQALAALRGFGHSLYAFGHAALTEMWNGLKSVGGSILSWLKNFIGGIPHAIMKLLGMSPPHPGSVFWDLGANMMRHLEAGIKSRARHVRAAAMQHFGGGGPAGGAPSAAAAYARGLLGRYGWGSQWGPLNYVAMRESGWSMTARNPSSGAYGIAQFINGPSEYYQWGGNPGTIGGQVTAFFNYIRSRYGSPAAAAAHEARFNWYGRGLQGGIFNRPTLIGVGESGPERVDVTPVGSRGARSGPLVHIDNFISNDATDPLLLSQRISFAVVSAGLGS